MEEGQEVTSRLQARFMMEELQSSAIPNSVIPPNARFLSYENMKKSVAFSPIVMKHPCVGYRVLAKPLRFKLWGAHEDLFPAETHQNLAANLS